MHFVGLHLRVVCPKRDLDEENRAPKRPVERF